MLLLEYCKTIKKAIKFFKESNYGITLNEFLILYAINQKKCKLSEISCYLDKDKSQALKELDVLLRKAFLGRVGKRYLLTDKGLNLLDEVMDAYVFS